MVSPVKIWRSQKKITHLLHVTGAIVSWTKVHVPSATFEREAPYVVAIVKLDNGKQYTAQLVDWNEHHVQIGQRVLVVLRRTKEAGNESVIPYGIKFQPI